MIKLSLINMVERNQREPDLYDFFGERLDELGGVSEDTWICGGAVRNLVEGIKPQNDYDMFFKTDEARNKFKKFMEENEAKVIRDVELNTTYEYDGMVVQAIKLNYPNIEAVLDSFDFTITQFGFDGMYLYCGDYSLYDLGRRTLVLHRLTYGISTLRRLLKYARYGYTACNGTLADILKRTVENPSVIDERVISLD